MSFAPPTVTVIDYGLGNLLSVRRALEHCGALVTVTGEPDAVITADRVVLPGVGAFARGMAELGQRGLDEAIRRYAAFERPLLGICLGMQLLFSRSEEFGSHPGLDLVKGQVVAIPDCGPSGQPHPVPHVGWNALIPSRRNWQGSLLAGLADGDCVYFVHSFTARPDQEEERLADCHYHGLILSAAIASGSLTGCQFHPEKSGPVGLQIITNFLAV